MDTCAGNALIMMCCVVTVVLLHVPVMFCELKGCNYCLMC